MSGHPDRDAIETCGGKIGNRAVICLRQHQRQRARPECLCQRDRPRLKAGNKPRSREIPDMGNQRIERGPALGLIEPRNRRSIGGIGAEAIDGLGRERDQPALGQDTHCRRHRGLAGGQNLGFQANFHCD